MNEPVKLLVPNQVVFSSLKKYIWFNKGLEQKKSALSLFFRFLVMEVYVDGFATDEKEYIGAKAFNKAIVNIDDLNEEEAVVFVEKNDHRVHDICQVFEVINPAIKNNQIIIFGAGKYGREVYRRLLQENIEVECFIDSDKAKYQGKDIQGELPIRSIDILQECTGKDIAVIEAAEKYKDMDGLLQKRGFEGKRFYYNNEQQEYRKNIFNVNGDDLLFSINAIGNMCVLFPNKKIFYYGEPTKELKRMGRQIRLLDFDFRGFLCDESEEGIDEDGYIIKYTEDILYEEDYYIILNLDERKVEKLYNLGLKKNFEFNILPKLGFDDCLMKSMLDLNLGYTYRENSQYPGIAIYGNDRESDFKIAALGGSTTDDLYDHRTWARVLYEMLTDEVSKQEVTIYNGGTCGYASTQELIKLIRDILPLKPNLIILYDGYNDLCQDPNRPFALPYLQTIFRYAQGNDSIEKVGSDGFGGDVSEINMGIKTNEDYFENWLSKIELMHAVAKTKNIPFLSFVQPSRFSMRNKRIKDEWYLSSFVFWMKEHHQAWDFRRRLESERIGEKYDYITDLSDIFDDHPEVYRDACHVWESGSRIIADKILNVMKKKSVWPGKI